MINTMLCVQFCLLSCYFLYIHILRLCFSFSPALAFCLFCLPRARSVFLPPLCSCVGSNPISVLCLTSLCVRLVVITQCLASCFVEFLSVCESMFRYFHLYFSSIMSPVHLYLVLLPLSHHF